jgi:hypothetical protein
MPGPPAQRIVTAVAGRQQQAAGKGGREMSRYERRVQFERWYAMREAYRAAPEDERRAVISVTDVIGLAETLFADQGSGEAGSSPASAMSDSASS